MSVSRLSVLLLIALSILLTSASSVLASTRLDNLIIDPQPPEINITNCIVTGCSGELCVDPATGPRNSTCMWKEEYACLKFARCERQGSGQCGWTQTGEYQACLTGAEPSITPTPEPLPSPSDAPVKPSEPPRVFPTTKVHPTPCTPRPACLDSHPFCLLAEPAEGWCPPVKPSPAPITNPNPSLTVTPISQPGVMPTLKPTWQPPFWPTWKPLARPLISDLPHASQTALTHLKALFSSFRLNYILWQNN